MRRKVEEEAHIGGQIDCSFIPHRLKDERTTDLARRVAFRDL